MTEFEYRTLNRVAQSDLSHLLGYKFPHKKQNFNFSAEALYFGTVFHQMVLEPLTLVDWEPFDADKLPIIRLTLNRMIQALFSGDEGKALRYTLDHSLTEQIAIWEDEETGLPCKAKLDIKRPSASGKFMMVHDLKTTSCKTEADFLKKCAEYGYERQAAFYLNSDPRAQIFEITAIQKMEPFNVFRFAFDRDSDFVKRGRKEIRPLMRSAVEELKKPNGWRPPSWSRKTELA